MENEGVDRTVIDGRQNHLGQMADIPPLLILKNFDLLKLMPFHVCSHFHFDANFGNGLYSKEKRPAFPLLF